MPLKTTATLRQLIIKLSLLILLLAATTASAYQTRIIGGQASQESAWPSIVRFEFSLPDGKKRLCAGNLISSQWVITAAHCFHNTAQQQVIFTADVEAYPGLHTLSQKKTFTSLGVQNIFIHPQFALNAPFDFDFALIELSHPVDLPVSSLLVNTPEVDELTTVLGWGVQELNAETNNPLSTSLATTLQEVDVPVISNQQCQNAMGASIRESMICAGYPQGGKDSCSGDSGSPMMVLRNGKYTQTGIVSFGIGCAQPNQYGVYARIEFALPWINELVSDIQLTDATTAQRKINAAKESELTPNSSQLGDEGVKITPRQGGGGSHSFLGLFALFVINSCRRFSIASKAS